MTKADCAGSRWERQERDRPRSGSGSGSRSGVADALDWLTSGLALGSAASRPPIRNQRPTNLSAGGDGLRAAKRASDQPLDGTRNCRRSDASWDCVQDLATTCRWGVKKRDLQPHLIRYWLTPPVDPQREETIGVICQVSQQAPALAKQGERTMSTDELTGAQAPSAQTRRVAFGSGKSGATRI